MTTYTPNPDEAALARAYNRAVSANQSNLQRRRKPITGIELKPLDSIGVDGQDHINISDEAATYLGMSLASNAPFTFFHYKFGEFCSIESFFYYLSSEERDDRLRRMTGSRLLAFKKRLTHRQVVNFRALIMEAHYLKITQTKDLQDVFTNTTLPFDCYYHYKRSDGLRIRHRTAYWMVPGFEEIRKALREGREPDFKFLCEQPDVSLEASLTMTPKKPNRRKQS